MTPSLLLLACTPEVTPEPTFVDGILLPDVSAAEWVDTVDNPYFPLPIGATWEYESILEDGSVESIHVEVLVDTKTVNGVAATVVYDLNTADGTIAEETWDWYAQDTVGNVWYLGEDTCEWEAGACVRTVGTWEWGVDGAVPGWLMQADPTVDGQPYFQEYLAGTAEDVGELLGVGESISVTAGDFSDCVRTADTSQLDATLQEKKTYCAGVGNVYVAEPSGAVVLMRTGGL